MGVTELFPQLKGAWRTVNLQESARGEPVGIDAFVGSMRWLLGTRRPSCWLATSPPLPALPALKLITSAPTEQRNHRHNHNYTNKAL